MRRYDSTLLTGASESPTAAGTSQAGSSEP